MPPSRTIIFVNNKKAADFLDDYLFNKGLPSTSIHSDRTQRQREDALYVNIANRGPRIAIFANNFTAVHLNPARLLSLLLLGSPLAD